MPDTTATNQTAASTATAHLAADIVVDKNKSNEQYITEAEAKYIIPKLVRNMFPDLIKLIYETESMNKEEREYWMQILPIMTQEQIVKFRDILVNEKIQLEKLDKDYQQEMSAVNQKHVSELSGEETKKRLDDIKQAEIKTQATDSAEQEKLLQQLNQIQ